jgi:glycosyltransferase involved in cell wall biosynthesis
LGEPKKLSIVVPAYQGATLLPKTLPAIVESDLPRENWELIVVDDASTDATARVAAQWADRVVSLPGRPHGPGYARNRGVEVCSGEWIMFIDADVRIHADTLSHVVRIIESDPSIDAMFGAYDDAPDEPDFVSQYRNLLHRYVHLQGAGDASTFWAGCGAIRRSAYVAVGGFDEQRYPRPQIEDIELGYRLNDHGHRIVLRPEIQGAHLKRWRFLPSARTDLFDRGVPWVTLLLERRNLHQPANLNLKQGERLKTVLACGGIAALLGGLVAGWPIAAVAGFLALAGVVLSNWAMLAWFARMRGFWFAIRVVPMNLWYYVVSGAAVAIALARQISRPRPTPAP